MAVFTDCLYWPPVQYVNFAYVDTKYRVLYVNITTVFYDIMLSYIKYDEEPLVDKKKAIRKMRLHKREGKKKVETEKVPTFDNEVIEEQITESKGDGAKLEGKTNSDKTK